MVTMNDIAARAGVSQTTVSFVLSGRENGVKLSEETRQRVLNVAQEMGYQRNELARAMVTGKSRVIGLINYDTDQQEHIWAIIGGALDEAALHGYTTKIVHLPFGGSREEVLEIIRSCRSWRLDALVSIALWPTELELLIDEMDRTRCPIAYIENGPPDKNAIRVSSDDESGIRAGIEHLVALGHRQIAFLSGPNKHPISTARVQCFQTIMQEMNLPLNKRSAVYSDWGDELAEQAANDLLNASKRPSGILCAGDALAMIVLRKARQLGLNVPTDLSVIGYGNFLMGRFADPPLTSIRQPFGDMGRVAVRRILSQIEPKAVAKPSTTTATAYDGLDATLVLRQSTGPVA